MVLGFDFGMKYIGVATGQLITKTATPLTSILAKDGIPNWDEVKKLITSWQPEALIVGLPLNMDGTNQLLTARTKKFANRLQQKFKLPIHFVDERLTTWEAKQGLFKQSKLSNQAILDLNARAAAIILSQWLSDQ